ncbi:hypothetical protein E2C01_019071 [Portunus trituberculatus]|uniref:Uncharacterized protein n=1 Tax=Portunus trituberculatus TaxID=210409 RepID=A0A5B7DY69_PORTR|nr:hypothetical protein [Portunus trituberculatus]
MTAGSGETSCVLSCHTTRPGWYEGVELPTFTCVSPGLPNTSSVVFLVVEVCRSQEVVMRGGPRVVDQNEGGAAAHWHPYPAVHRAAQQSHPLPCRRFPARRGSAIPSEPSTQQGSVEPSRAFKVDYVLL